MDYRETITMSLESKLRGLLAPDLLRQVCEELAQEVVDDLRSSGVDFCWEADDIASF